MVQLLSQQSLELAETTGSFRGFAAPTSNTTFTPNQFFDVCLPHYSRGVVRLVGFMIRQALGWCDPDGNPQSEQVRLTYQHLVTKVGISRGQIRKSLDEAIAGGFIECVTEGKPSAAYSPAETASYQLRWDSGLEYIKDPAKFRGFFEHEGNRTDIPNQFFDEILPSEPLAVIKVVGSVIRFSIGFQAKHGRRRQQVHLSYRDIQRYSHIPNPNTLADALRVAQSKNYICLLEPGYFDTDAGRRSRPATYALRWADVLPLFLTGSKTVASISERQRFEKRSGTGSKTAAEYRFENRSDIETKLLNETSKQQQPDVAAILETESLLKEQGFTEMTAKDLAGRFEAASIVRQVEWLPNRGPIKSRLGMLRRAIEEAWPAPDKLRSTEVPEAREFARNFYAGLAGNDGSPVAEPSVRDLETSEALVARLRVVEATDRDIATFARSFGNYVRERRMAGDLNSLVLAARLHGDSWLVRLQRERQARHEAEVRSQRDEHRERYRNGWLAFLSEAEEGCRKENPAEYAEFLKSRAASPWRNQESELEGGRLMEFQRRFHLPDFWHWDSEFNHNPFKTCE